MAKKFLERKVVTWTFAAIAIVSGFLFLDTTPTGNVIMNKQNPTNLISIIGLLLIACSTVLIAYSIKKR